MNQLVYALILIPIILIVSTAIYNNFSTNIDQTGWSSEANDTLTKINTGTWNGYKLASMLPFIFIALIIVSAIIGAIVKFAV